MKKIVLSLFVLFLSLDANAQDAVKMGRIHLDKTYTLELRYLTEASDTEISSSRTTYTAEEYDCGYHRPATCSTSVHFSLGNVQVRILDSNKEIFNQTALLKGFSSFEHTPTGLNQCNPSLPMNRRYSVYLGIQDLKFNHNSKTYQLSVDLNSASVAVKDSQIQPAVLNFVTAAGWADVGGKRSHWNTSLYTNEEWNEIHEAARNAPYIEPRD